MKHKSVVLVCGAVAVVCAVSLLAIQRSSNNARSPYREWRVYGGGPDSIRYSELDQINRENVKQLEVAWTFDTGDAFQGSEMQCNPIIVDGTMYATSPKLRVIALDAATGKLRWRFDPNQGKAVVGKNRNRGVVYWSDGKDRRIFVAARHHLYAIDARNGKPVPSFGENGRIDLRVGLGRDPETLNVGANTPGIIYKDLLILGSLVPEGLPSAPGHIRAFDVRTGKMRWIFRTIPQPGEYGYETWPKDTWKHTGGANNWAGMALDEKRGIVFAPTGSAAFDFYGSDRHGDNLFANTLLALKADTGERIWHFQAVKHDVWDRDFPAPPTLVTLERDGKKVDAVAQITKSGHVYVFERETGKPLFPIEYRKVPPSDVDGELLAETQPLPLKPPPIARQIFTEELITKRTPAAHKAVLERFRTMRSGDQFTPPGKQMTIIIPGLDGGGEWGGAGFDPATGLLYVNSNDLPWYSQLVERRRTGERPSGKDLYVRNCAACHREDLRGTPPEFPALLKMRDKYSDEEMSTIIRRGVGRMPGFSNLQGPAVRAISDYIMTGKDTVVAGGAQAPSPMDLKYTISGYHRFLDPDGYPAIEPPWGTLNAIDLNKGEIVWRIPFGEYPELAAKGIPVTGTENYGGPVVTAGGLIFIGATNHDRKFRAFDKSNGKLLWETILPTSGNATPAAYEVNGRQFVVIGAGGGKGKVPTGGTYVAFALPEKAAAKK